MVRRLITLAFFFFSKPLFAQSFYANSGYHLWHHDADQNEWTQIGQIQDSQTGEPVSFPDIASDYEGHLYGISIQWVGGELRRSLYRIDRFSGQATSLFPVNAWGTGLVFTPDGRLWAVGGSAQCSTQCLTSINVHTGESQVVSELDFSPAGDLAYHPNDGMLYMTSGNLGGRLIKINPQTGQTSVELVMPSASTYFGVDFVGNTNRLLIFASPGHRLEMQKDSTGWSEPVTSPCPSSLSGATQFHCKPEPQILLNSAPMRNQEMVSCGQAALITAKDLKVPNGHSAKYRWNIEGQNSRGEQRTVQLDGVGVPRELNLTQDPEFFPLELTQFFNSSERQIKVTLTLWCDLYSRPVTISRWIKWVGPEVKFALRPDVANFEYEVGTQLQFVEVTQPQVPWQQQQWTLDSHLILMGTSKGSQVLELSDIGTHELEYQVQNSHGCRASHSIPYQVTQNVVYFPTGFTPNGDGLNDEFYPVWDESSGVDSFQWFIFNRQGELIFSDQGQRSYPTVPIASPRRWDGTYRGQIVPEGIYLYRFEYRQQNKSFLKTGSIHLLR